MATKRQTLEKTKFYQPKLYKVILHNDDITTMDFVIEILVMFFNKNIQQATEIMLEVHTNGKGICGIYTHEIAKTKQHQVLNRAKTYGFPLKCSLEMEWNLIENSLEFYIDRARKLALEKNHEYTTAKHVFLSVLNLNFKGQNKTIDFLISNLNNLISQIPQTKNHPQDSVELVQICQYAISLGQYDQFEVLDFFNVFLTDIYAPVLKIDENHEMLELFKFCEIDINNFLYNISLISKNATMKHDFTRELTLDKLFEEDDEDENFIELYTTNLTKKARDGKIEEIIGRKDEIERILQILSRKKKNNPVLVGEAGVGKSAVVEALALMIANNKVPKKLKNKEIYELDTMSIVAGSKYRGDLEERVNNLIKQLKKEKNAILFIDEIHAIIGTGSTEGSLDISNLLKPALSNGELSCIGSTTYDDFRNFEKDKALARRFSKVDICEPSVEYAVEILKASKVNYEKFHNVRYSDEIIEQSVEFAKRYLHDRFLPDSAFDLIDEVGSSLSLRSTRVVNVTQKDLTKTISKYANIENIEQNSSNDKILKNLNKNLKSKIFGQNLAVDLVTNSLIRSYAGLKDENRPIGVFLFTGSSGVGKSELAKLLAKFLNVNFERFDMSEFMEAHSVAKLIGSPPGYVGHKEGGVLINNIKKHPYSVVLFDEIEKAHSDVVNIFLQIFDNARLTGSDGVSANFQNTIIILTSNLGTKEPNQIGFTKIENHKTENAIKGFFAPEFINRLDKIVYFESLSEEILDQILDKYIEELEAKLKNIKLNLTKEAKGEIIKQGYNLQFGARNLKRTLQESISDEISKAIVFQKLKDASIKIDFKNGKFEFKYLWKSSKFTDRICSHRHKANRKINTSSL